MAHVQLTRLLQLMALLRGRCAQTPQSLARELEVSKRTLFRYVNALERAGMPYRFDREEGRYQASGDFYLPPMQLTLGEAMALSVLGSQLAGRGQLPLLQDAWRAVTKIRSQLPAAIRQEVAQSDGSVRIQGARVSPQEGCDGHFELIRQAIATCRKVRCIYDGGKHGKKPFLFRPYSLFFSQRAWYAIGHSEASGGERSLKLNRITTLEPTDRPYAVPDDWTLEKSLGCAWRMIRGDRRHHVRIRFDREVARNVADTLWHPTQTIEWQPGGDCLFQCEVDGLDEIFWWVLGYGSYARVLEPVEFIERMGETARKLSQAYWPAERQPPKRQRAAHLTGLP